MTISVAAHMPKPTSVISPVKISHYGIRTTHIEKMKVWYLTVLGAAVVFESDKVCLMTFDDEHHRVALIHVDNARAPLPEKGGIEHVAMSYVTFGDLVSTYERLKVANIKPDAAINHGPTTSFYYSDPDGNHLELLVDNFTSIEELQAWFETGAHERHPGGKPFDPDELAKKFHAGEREPEVLT